MHGSTEPPFSGLSRLENLGAGDAMLTIVLGFGIGVALPIYALYLAHTGRYPGQRLIEGTQRYFSNLSRRERI